MKDELFSIDKKSLLKLLSKDEDNHYLYNLYKVYDLANKITGNNLTKVNLLKEKEDQIYTINGKVLSEKQRILLELKRISKEMREHKDSISKEEQRKIARLILPVLDAAENKELVLDSSYEKTENGVKKRLGTRDIKITIAQIEAMLDLPINFLYEGAVAFLSSAVIEYMNDINIIADEKISNVKFNNIVPENYKIVKDSHTIYNAQKDVYKDDDVFILDKGAKK